MKTIINKSNSRHSIQKNTYIKVIVAGNNVQDIRTFNSPTLLKKYLKLIAKFPSQKSVYMETIHLN